MSVALKKPLLSDSEDDDEPVNEAAKPCTSFEIKPSNTDVKNHFFSELSGSESDSNTGASNRTSQKLNSFQESFAESDDNASPVIKRFPTKRRRLVSENSFDIEAHEKDTANEIKPKKVYQLSSSSDEENGINNSKNKAAQNSRMNPTPISVEKDISSSDEENDTNNMKNIAAQNSRIEPTPIPAGKYVIPISRRLLAGPRKSADPMKKSKIADFPVQRKKHKHSKTFSTNDDNTVDESYQKNEFDSDLSLSENEDGKTISFPMKEKILSFFQESSEEELTTLSKCSSKKASVLMSLRPFQSWKDLLFKLDNTKSLSRDNIWSCIDLIHERQTLCGLMDNCSEISRKLEAEFNRFHDSSSQSPKKFCGDVVVQQQPSNLISSRTLKPYQMIGLNWLALLHRNKVNGILADEMGLGKTIQTISFLAYLQDEGISDGPHLVIVPSSTLDNWIRELNTWCPSLSVVLYNGSQSERKSIRHQLLRGYIDCNVILTTYNLAISVPEDRALFKKLGVYYAVFDEGHMLKNMSSQRFQHLMRISATHRLLLTGTPLQNNLLELMSLLRFVMPHMFKETTSSLVRMFSHSNSDNSSSFAKQRINQAKLIMQPFVLRRLKSEVLHQLPKKIETICRCDMTPEQAKLYENVKAKFKNKTIKQNMPKTELRNVFVEFRKVANHPVLRREHYPDSILRIMAKSIKNDVIYAESNETYVFEDMQVMSDFELHNLCNSSNPIRKYKLSDSVLLNSGKFLKLDEVLPQLKLDGKRILIFSQFTMMMDIMEVYLKIRGHKFLRLDGQTPVSDRLKLIDKFNNDSSYFVFVLSTKAGGLGINLTGASVVILHDIDCNPYNDKQAEDRCHRLGQSKEVEVIKLVSKNTIEESMLQCAEYKLQLEKDMTKGDVDAVDMAALITQSLS